MDTNKRPRNSLCILPDEILIMILSCLPWKEAVRTSVLSHTWKNLWKYFSGSMEFDATETMKLAIGDNNKLYTGACKTRDCVNQVVLNSHEAPSLQGLKVVVGLDLSFTDSINRWIDFAIVKRVKRLELDLSVPPAHLPYVIKNGNYSYYKYTFPDWLLDLPPILDFSSSSCFDTLETLIFKGVNLSEQVLVTHFLSDKTCPLLQHLCLDDIPSIRCLRVAGPRLKLKHLEIKNCINLEDLKVSAPKLIVFKYEGRYLDNMPLQDVPLLSSLTLGGVYCHTVIPRGLYLLSTYNISQLQRLVLNVELYMVIIQRFLDEQVYQIPEFSNLKQLEVTFTSGNEIFHNMLFLSLLVHASPRLCEFAVRYSIIYSYPSKSRSEIYGGDHHRPKITKCSHENLKVVEFSGWVGLESDFELAMHLSQIGVSLDKMIIDTRNPFSDVKSSSSIDKIEAARERATQLSINLPPQANLIIL